MKPGLCKNLALLSVAILIVLASCNRGQPPAEVAEAPPAAPEPIQLGPITPGTAPPNPYDEEQILHGQHLVRYAGCNDCHTPWTFDPELGIPRPDMSRMLSGHPHGAPDPQGSLGAGDIGLIGPTFTSFALPFGVVYSPNLTPDIDTGIGSWTEEMFVDIFRKGRHLGGDGRGILPPMPWWWFRNLPDDDLRAIYAYLRSIPPIRNAVPSPAVPEEAIWQLRDSFDRMTATLPQEEWVAGSN